MKVVNRISRHYSSTSVIQVKAPAALTKERKILIKKLIANDCKVELMEKIAYFPHVTIRLGVPLKRAARREFYRKIRQQGDIRFTRACSIVIVHENNKRSAREIIIDG